MICKARVCRFSHLPKSSYLTIFFIVHIATLFAVSTNRHNKSVTLYIQFHFDSIRNQILIIQSFNRLNLRCRTKTIFSVIFLCVFVCFIERSEAYELHIQKKHYSLWCGYWEGTVNQVFRFKHVSRISILYDSQYICKSRKKLPVLGIKTIHNNPIHKCIEVTF